MLGSISVRIKLESQDEPVASEFIIVRQNGPPLIGRSMMKNLNVSITRSGVNTISNVRHFENKFPELFDPGLGCLKNVLVLIR